MFESLELRFINYCKMVPVKCKTGIIADGKTGKRLEYIVEKGRYIPYSGNDKSKFVNQKLTEPIYTYRINFTDNSLESVVSVATHVSKHGLNWKDIHKAVFDFKTFRFRESGEMDASYWYRPEKSFNVAEDINEVFPYSTTPLSNIRGNTLDPSDSTIILNKHYWIITIKKIPFIDLFLNGNLFINPFDFLWLLYSGEYMRVVNFNRSFKNQKFGLELEFTGIARGSAAKVISKVLGTKESFIGGIYKKHRILDKKGRSWFIMRDSSISPVKERSSAPEDYYKCELVTPICNYEDIAIITKIIKALKERGMIVNSSCGIHIHVDGKDHTARSLKNLTNIMACKELLIFEALNTSHSRTIRWCKSVNKAFLEGINKEKI